MRLPGSLLMSQLSCFLEMLVQLRSRAAGCLRMIPLSMRGVMDLQRFRLMCFQSLLSQHLMRQAAGVYRRTLYDEERVKTPFCAPLYVSYSPSVPRPAHTHADTKISVSQVTKHHHPHLSSHHMRFITVQRQSVGRRADGRGSDHVALHLDAFWRRPAGKWTRAYGCYLRASVPAERRVATLRLVHLPPSVSQPITKVAAAVIERPPRLLVVHFVLRLSFYRPVVLICQAVLCFQRSPVLVGQTFLRFKCPAALISGGVLCF